MDLTCKYFTLLLFVGFFVGTSTVTLKGDTVSDSHINTLTQALIRTLRMSSPSVPTATFKHTNVVSGMPQQNTNSPKTLSKNLLAHQSSIHSNPSLESTDNLSKASTWFGFLKYVRSSMHTRRNVSDHAEDRSPYSSLLSNMTAPDREKLNKKEVPHNAFLLNLTITHPVSTEVASKQSYQNRSRRGAFPLLPDNYMERQSYFSPTETCQQKDMVRVLQPPGCIRRTVRSSLCEGTCHSRSVPQWDIELQQLRHVAYCTCCKPHQLSYRRTRFRCPGRERRVLVMYIGVASQCACRPCAEADPVLQQPYDY